MFFVSPIDGALWVFFFFQAEDGIRDGHVTGVQTCALPISLGMKPAGPAPAPFVAFIGSGAGQQGVYACDRFTPGDPCTPVANLSTPIPGGTGTFTGFT